ILSQLIYVRSGIGTFTVTSLGYDQATLAPAFSVPGSAQLHFGSQSCGVSLKALPQQGAGFFEVLHPLPKGLEVLQGIIEPVRQGERLSLRHYPPAGTHFLPAVTYSAPGPTNLTYFRGGNGVDYLR